jgi:hypothetical protein
MTDNQAQPLAYRRLHWIHWENDMELSNDVIGNPNAAHLYEANARRLDDHGHPVLGEPWKAFTVSAHNRDHAARMLARIGYEVCDMNMVG